MKFVQSNVRIKKMKNYRSGVQQFKVKYK